MSKKNRTKPKNVSGIRPVNLQFRHPVENLSFYIGRLRAALEVHLELAAEEVKECDRDENRSRLLRQIDRDVLPVIEMAEITAKGISRWIRFGMMDGAGPFETRVRVVLDQLDSIYRRAEDFENAQEDTCAEIKQCHAEIVVIQRKLRAAPLAPNDDAESMWSVYIAVFYRRLNNVAKCLPDLESRDGKSVDSIADSCKQMQAAIDALDAVLGSVKGQLANALYVEGQYRWPIERLPVCLATYTLWFPKREPSLRDPAWEALNHLRHILAVLVVSKRPAMPPKAQARMWKEFPSDARALKLSRPTTRATARTVEADANSETASGVNPTKLPDPVALTSTEAIHTVNSMLELALTGKNYRRWMDDHDVRTYTREQWRARFDTEPKSIKGNPALIEASNLMQAVTLEMSRNESEKEMERIGRVLGQMRPRE